MDFWKPKTKDLQNMFCYAAGALSFFFSDEEVLRILNAVKRAQSRDLPYHNWDHVERCLAFIFRSDAKHQVQAYAAVIAIFHDLVYVPGAKNNEELSEKAFCSLVWDHSVINSDVVSFGIFATRHSSGVAEYLSDPLSILSAEDDEAVILAVDADLSSLASEPKFFDRNSFNIALENGFTGPPNNRDFILGCAEALKKFLPDGRNRTQVFYHPTSARYEEAALSNLRRAIARAEALLKL